MSHTIITGSFEETEAFGSRLGKLLRSGDVLCLSGDLGAGKTCLTRGLAGGWGAIEHPTSPTFTLINEYTREADRQRFYHMDCYRLSGAVEAQTTGLDDILDAEGVLVIEWPERIREALPSDHLWIAFTDRGESEREMVLSSTGPRSTELIAALA